MYIQRINTKQNGKVYPSIVLCHSYRENGKQKRKILATLTKWPVEIMEGLEKIIKGNPVFSLEDLEHSQGKKFGGLWVFLELARRTGLVEALGDSKQGKLALLQVLARCLDPSSRLHIANHWPEHYALEEVLKISGSFTEDDLYFNLDWLSENQQKIENRLFHQKHHQQKRSEIYLYDVTSSYFEGTKNELSEFGYNRDKKKGKKQIVIGLLCDHEGDPISVEVFKGNTSDLNTLQPQLEKLKENFGVERVVMVGDKGLIKSTQIDQIGQLEWHYITSITKAQIESLIKQDVIQMELFEDQPIEVKHEQIRYILRRNDQRARLIADNRAQKIAVIQNLITLKNTYLNEHPRAKIQTAVKQINAKINQLNLPDHLFEFQFLERTINISINEQTLKEIGLLDGCYVIKTEIDQKAASTQTVHDRYKDLAKVEHAFKTIKTGLEEVRPIFLRKESRTRGHVFICMLAYKLIHKFRSYINDLNKFPTIKEMISSLNDIQYSTYNFQGKKIKVLPSKFNPTQTKILKTLDIKFPTKVYAK